MLKIQTYKFIKFDGSAYALSSHPNRQRHRPQLVAKRHQLLPCVQHDTSLKNSGFGFLQMAQALEVFAVYCGAGFDLDTANVALAVFQNEVHLDVRLGAVMPQGQTFLGERHMLEQL